MFSDYLTKTYPETTSFLTNALLKNKLANSYVLISNKLDDILLLTINLAKTLNCKNNAGTLSKSCNECTNCRWLDNNSHPQALITIKAALQSKKEQVNINEIRELLNILKVTSEFFRIILFESSNISSLPPESCNLLLKTIEEAPEKTLFIFANTSRNDILPTILSRSQTIYLSKKNDLISKFSNNRDKELTSCFSHNIQSSLEKAKNAQEYIEKNKLSLKDYLLFLAYTNYSELKDLNTKKYCLLYKNLSKAYLKWKSFMQPKIVFEDLFLNLKLT